MLLITEKEKGPEVVYNRWIWGLDWNISIFNGKQLLVEVIKFCCLKFYARNVEDFEKMKKFWNIENWNSVAREEMPEKKWVRVWHYLLIIEKPLKLIYTASLRIFILINWCHSCGLINKLIWKKNWWLSILVVHSHLHINNEFGHGFTDDCLNGSLLLLLKFYSLKSSAKVSLILLLRILVCVLTSKEWMVINDHSLEWLGVLSMGASFILLLLFFQRLDMLN